MSEVDGPRVYHEDVDRDFLFAAPAEIPGVGAGVYFRTAPNGSSVPAGEIPALIQQLQGLADYATRRIEEDAQ